MRTLVFLACLATVGLLLPITGDQKAALAQKKGKPKEGGGKAGPDNTPPKGFTALFNGKDLTNWQGLIELPQRAKYKTPEDLKAAQEKANAKVLPHWKI